MRPDLETLLNTQELARQLAEKRVSVIDVREAMEFAGGHTGWRRPGVCWLQWFLCHGTPAGHAVPCGFGLNALIPRAVTRDQQPSASGSIAASVWRQMHALIRSC